MKTRYFAHVDKPDHFQHSGNLDTDQWSCHSTSFWSPSLSPSRPLSSFFPSLFSNPRTSLLLSRFLSLYLLSSPSVTRCPAEPEPRNYSGKSSDSRGFYSSSMIDGTLVFNHCYLSAMFIVIQEVCEDPEPEGGQIRWAGKWQSERKSNENPESPGGGGGGNAPLPWRIVRHQSHMLSGFRLYVDVFAEEEMW